METIFELKAKEFETFLDKPKEEILEKYKKDLRNIYADGGIRIANQVREKLKELDNELVEAIEEKLSEI